MQRETIKELTPRGMLRRANQLDQDALELCRRAQQLRSHARKLLAERAKSKAKR